VDLLSRGVLRVVRVRRWLRLRDFLEDLLFVWRIIFPFGYLIWIGVIAFVISLAANFPFPVLWRLRTSGASSSPLFVRLVMALAFALRLTAWFALAFWLPLVVPARGSRAGLLASFVLPAAGTCLVRRHICF
jgi:Na+/pantothenate symporter